MLLILLKSSEDAVERTLEKVSGKSTTPLKLEEPILDELIKGIQELNLNLKAVNFEDRGSSSTNKPFGSRPEGTDRCIWCDSLEHRRKDCDDFNDAYERNVVFWKDRKLHLTEIGLPIRTNFGRGGMKKVVEDMVPKVSVAEVVTYGMQVYANEDEEGVKAEGNLWPYALKTTERGKVAHKKLQQVGNSIQKTTGWTDPVDSLSVYAYITKAQANEAMVEEKRKRDDEAPGTSKRATRSNAKKDEEPKPKAVPVREEQMEDISKEKKPGKPRGPSYKLKSDIELATNLKKVFEERILNSKVEMTLGDILGIAKREFHEEIIDIIKQK